MQATGIFRIKLKSALVVPFVLASSLWSPLAAAADLKVTLNNLRGAGGTVYVALYDNAENFPKEGKGVAGQFFPATGQSASAMFFNLKPGRYALSVYHDENGNGHLDTNLLGVPVERYGFSGDASGSLGAPSFEDASVDVEEDTSIIINLR